MRQLLSKLQRSRSQHEVVVTPEEEATSLDPDDEPVTNPACPPPKKQKDENCQTSRAIQSAKKASAKAIAQRDAVMEGNNTIWG